MNAWTAALTADTIARSIPDAHMAWLAHADAGSRLVRHLDTGEVGHVYPDVRTTPIGWALMATRDPEQCPGDCEDDCAKCGSRDPREWCDDCQFYASQSVTFEGEGA